MAEIGAEQQDAREGKEKEQHTLRDLRKPAMIFKLSVWLRCIRVCTAGGCIEPYQLLADHMVLALTFYIVWIYEMLTCGLTSH